jgi:hypothetical protein
VFERWRGTLFCVFLVFGIAAAALAGLRVVEAIARPGGPRPAMVLDLVIRIGSAATILWLAWFVFRRRSAS